MALMSVLFDIAAKTASFESSMTRVERRLEGVAHSARQFGEMIGVAFGTKELLEFANKTVERADQLNKMSQSAGIAAEQLSKLQFAARQSGVETEGLATGIKKFSTEINSAASGNKQAIAAFDAIGVSVRDSSGNIRDTSSILSDVAAKYQTYGDGAAKSALSVQLFGKQGTALIPLLNQGADGLKMMGDQAERFGLVISQETAKAAEEFHDKLSLLRAGLFEGFGNRIMAELLPTLNDLADTLLTTAESTDGMERASSAAATGVKILTDFALTAIHTLNDMGTWIGKIGAQIVAFVSGNWGQIATIQKEFNADMEADEKAYQARSAAIWRAGGDDVLREIKLTAQKRKNTLLFDSAADAKGSQELLDFYNIHSKKTTALEDFYREREILTRTGLEKELDEVHKKDQALEVLYNNGIITYAEYVSRKKELDDEQLQYFYTTLNHQKEATSDYAEYAKQAAQSIQQSFADFLFDPFQNGLTGMLSGFLTVLRRMVAEIAAKQILQATGLQGFIGSLIGGLTGVAGARASGGPVTAGNSYLVGEKGPELFTPNVSGGITPNNQMAGQSVTIVQNIDARGATMELTNALPGILKEHAEQVKQDIIDGLRRRRWSIA